MRKLPRSARKQDHDDVWLLLCLSNRSTISLLFIFPVEAEPSSFWFGPIIPTAIYYAVVLVVVVMRYWSEITNALVHYYSNSSLPVVVR